VQLVIFDVHGRQVGQLVDATRSPGKYRAVWQAEELPSGVYFARLQMPARTEVAKLILLR